jgi:hypothetical protein
MRTLLQVYQRACGPFRMGGVLGRLSGRGLFFPRVRVEAELALGRADGPRRGKSFSFSSKLRNVF